jgi:hypothetical protein
MKSSGTRLLYLATAPWRTAAIAALVFLLSAGCRQSASDPAVATQPVADRIDEPPADPAPTESNAAAASAPAAAGPAEKSAGNKEEFWEAYSMQGSRVGYAHTTIGEVVEEGQTLIRTQNHAVTSMKRGGQTVKQQMTLTSWDTPEGQFVRFETRMTAGPGEVVTRGRIAGGMLNIEVTTLGKTQSQAIPWNPAWGGLFASDRSLRDKPLKPGDTRTVRSLVPLLNVAGDTEMEAADYETVKLPAGETKLLRVETTVDFGGQKIDTTLWIDEQGRALKSYVPAIQQEAVRTTKEDALRPQEGGQFDLLVASAVPLKGKLPNPTLTKRVVYKAHVTSGKIDGVFANSLSQRVKKIDDQTVALTALAVRPDLPETLDLEPPKPTDEDLAANNLIQSDDAAVVALAEKIAPSEKDPWKLACALEKHVDQTIKLKNFSQAFATAAEVAQSLEGDCTEHAVLLAALCRARQIPARVAFGLVYYPPQKGFAYHMWNEVWIADRWVPMDATLGLSGIGGDHIKLGDHSLAGLNAYSALLPVIQVFGRLELEVIEAE